MPILWNANLGVYFDIRNILLQKNDINANFLEYIPLVRSSLLCANGLRMAKPL